ncbi:helicase [Blastopirellula marina]|uniref:Helicase n=1 Tax=Blastopirellula marina TaxID=124 RepID=A0A2S8G366_9BACT|nr:MULTISPECIES: DISARM system helicase DrmA [Pirellulaceae]PQO38863.1 helicase [Blastopirellula marina]RCS55171.1 helicase [Bremerella cremea]
MTSLEVRRTLVDSLLLDLIGPTGPLGDHKELLPQSPSRWYLTGFLVPTDADEEQRCDPTSNDELDQAAEPAGIDDSDSPEKTAARRSYLPSSMGISVLVSKSVTELEAVVRYGEYLRVEHDEGYSGPQQWQRVPKEEIVPVTIGTKVPDHGVIPVPNSRGVELVWSVRGVPDSNLEGGLPNGTRSLSLFVVNRRKAAPDETRDEGFIFQVELALSSTESFVARPNLRSLESDDWDERVADLQYREAYEFAVGHSVATDSVVEDAQCRTVRTSWLPTAEVEKVAPSKITGVTLEMELLANLQDGTDAQDQLGAFVSSYKTWIDKQRGSLSSLSQHRRDTAEELLHRANIAANRIQSGIELLADPQCLDAFRLANKAMAAQGRRRLALQLGKRPEEIVPAWRPFQLAFILMNLKGIAEPKSNDRELVDLLFFPTGGGKTEAYLGLAAFTLVLRRLRNPGLSSAGLSVLMRYTLRLLTLDQLGRAAALVCALELERQQDVQKLGEWPFEIGLWVGMAATPNRMGRKGDTDSHSARRKTIAFKNDDRKPSPIPLEECPWCGEKFRANSFQLLPSTDDPTDLRVTCANRHCDFSRGNSLPILSVDEPIYRRLPCFLIATVDKFAAMPWTGEVGGFFGRVDRVDAEGFYGPCNPSSGRPLPVDRLPPIDLVIQDELHLISGPLGTMVGLYESALDELSAREVDGQHIRPKIIASTATVRRAQSQIRALFNRRDVDVFPPPGPDIRDSFFARTHTTQESNARQYVGIAAQGRSPKVIMLRVYLALLGAAQKAYDEAGGRKVESNPADPYMTLLGYFNSLRELGGARRLIEDEVRTQLIARGSRRRIGEVDGLFKDRTIAYEPVELTSRVTTDKVSEAKRRLEQQFKEKEHVDVAIATNMISVGLDITRLGLMVCFGQPKTSSEYIQATSRVGRDDQRPGLVVTILNIHRPRDRSHYERYAAFHESFYRSVEATSVTPFSPRALDRGLAGTLISLIRQGHLPMTPPRGATEILRELPRLAFAVKLLAERAFETQTHDTSQQITDARELRMKVEARCKDLLDEWEKIAKELHDSGGALQYQTEAGSAQRLLYEFLNPELKTLPPRHKKFRANRSMRDVEPSVNLWLKTIDGVEIESEEEDT